MRKRILPLLLATLLLVSCISKPPVSVITAPSGDQTTISTPSDTSEPTTTPPPDTTPEETDPPTPEVVLPQNPVSDAYQLQFAEEFDSPLNMNFWSYRTGTRLGAENRAANVTVSNGWLRITCEVTSNGTLTCGGIISREFFGYGYYETKVRLYTGGRGVHTSFWSMGGTSTETPRPKQNTIFELDGFEFDSDYPTVMQFNLNYKVDEKKGLIEKKTVPSVAGRDVVVGYEWLPDRVNWYMDGELIYTVTDQDAPLHYAQQAVWLTALLTDQMTGNMDTDPLPGVSAFDYFRYYAMPLEGVNVIGASEFEYNENEGFVETYPLNEPMGWATSGTTGAVNLLRAADAYAGNYVLKMASPNGSVYSASALQRLFYLPNGNYECSVMVKAPTLTGTATLTVVTAAGTYTAPIPACSEWTEVRIPTLSISDGKARITVSIDGYAGDVLFIDNPCLAALSGETVTKAAPFLPDIPGDAGVTFFDTTSDNYAEYGENWKSSSLMGMEHRSRYRQAATTESYAEWTFTPSTTHEVLLEIGVPATAQNPSRATLVTVTKNGTQILQETGGASLRENTWVSFGNFTAEAGATYVVRITVAQNNTMLRTDSMRLTATDYFSLNESILLSVDGGKAIVLGARLPVNDAPAALIANNTVYLEAEWLSAVLNQTVQSDYTANGKSYLSAAAITAQLAYQVSVAGESYVLLTPDTPPTFSSMILSFFEDCFA